MEELSNNKFRPPKLADRFLSWFCKESWLEPIRGDLFEQYQQDRKDVSRWKANVQYWLNVFNFLRPFALKKNRFTSNYTAMFKNTLTTFFRHLRRNPTQSAINILGLCIGFAVVFLSTLWVNYHTGFDRFHDDLATIYQVKVNSSGSDGIIQTNGGVIYEMSEEANATIPEVKAVTRIISNWRWPSEQCFKINENNPCVYKKGIFADSSFFQVFDFNVLSGPENPIVDPKSIAISKSLSEKIYGDENPVGKTYLVDNHFEVTITAVFEDIPANSSLKFEFIAPLHLAFSLWGQDVNALDTRSFITYAKLEEGSQKVVQEKMNELSTLEKYPNQQPILHPYQDVHLISEFKDGKAQGGLIDYVNIIRLFAIFILIMSIANFINLTTAQASIRGKEIGVRKVNGATQTILQLQFLFETFLKVFIAATIALLLTYLILPILNEAINEKMDFTFNQQLLVQIAIVLVVTTLLAGFYPALLMSRFNPVHILKNLSFKGSGSGAARRTLTGVQIGISGIIVILTSVFSLQLNFLQDRNIGYDREGIMILEPTYRHIVGFDKFVNGLKQHHQIKSVGISNANMINAGFATDKVDWSGKSSEDQISFKLIGGDNGLMDVFEIKFLEGKGFNPSDTSNQVILSRSAVERMSLDVPLGQIISIFGQECKVSGVIEDFNTESLHEDILPLIFHEIKPQNAGTFYVRYDKTQPLQSIEIIEEQYDELESFFNMKFKILDEEYQKAYNEEQVISKLSTFAMGIALVIAIIGILGLSTFNVLRRYREIGLRKIFGASGIQIIKILSKEFVIIVLIANVVASAFSLWVMSEWLSGFAYRIDTPYGIFIINLVLTLLVIIGLIGAQAIRVSKLNPSVVIRYE